jgi:5,10-methylenetetrahydrofolate reductase
LAQRQKPVLHERVPPAAGGDLKTWCARIAVEAREQGIRYFNLPDCPMGTAKMRAWAAALELRKELDRQGYAETEVIPHLRARDVGELEAKEIAAELGAKGIRDLVVLTGDGTDVDGERPSVKLLRAFQGGYRGRSLEIGLGCVFDPNAEDVEWEWAQFREKVLAGAQFGLSQFLGNISRGERWIERTRGAGLATPLLFFEELETANGRWRSLHRPFPFPDQL